MAERCASSDGDTTRMPFSSAQRSSGSCSVRAYCAMSSTPSSASMPTDVVMPWKSWNGRVTISKRRAAGGEEGVYSGKRGEAGGQSDNQQNLEGAADAAIGPWASCAKPQAQRDQCDHLK